MTQENKQAAPPLTYAQIVWMQLKHYKGAVFSLYSIIVVFALALLAPFIAHRLPFVWTMKTADGKAETTYPFFREFFAPFGAPEKFLERSFNYVLLLIIAWGVSRLVGYLTEKIFGKEDSNSWGPSKNILLLRRGIFAALAIAALVPFFTVRVKLDTTPFRQMQREGKGDGLFPIIPYGPFETSFSERIPPTWWDSEKTAAGNFHLFGTDNVGRDVLVRIIHGARVSLAVGIVSVVISTILGVIIGSIAGYFGGWIDDIISRIIEIVICFPAFFLILTIIAMVDQRSIMNIILILGLLGWTGIARLVRGEVLKQRSLDYVTASIALGAKSSRTIFRHILPNALAPVLVSISFGIAGSILTESGLSFLGFGVDIPTASWGELLNQAREAPHIYWWLVTFPGIPIFVIVTMYNMLGEGLRDALDPRLRGGE